MNEFELIERIFVQQQAAQSAATGTKNSIEKGIGDDAAVMAIPAGSRLVSCIDTLVQGRHFHADFAQVHQLAFEIGYKAVAVNVSDIARYGWYHRQSASPQTAGRHETNLWQRS